MTYSFFIDIDMDSDWGVATGAGVVGGIDSVIERDRRGQPVLRGTVLTGILRENARLLRSLSMRGIRADHGPAYARESSALLRQRASSLSPTPSPLILWKRVSLSLSASICRLRL